MADSRPLPEGFGLPDDGAEAGGLVFGDYLAILRRRAWVILAVFVIVVTIGTVAVFKATPIYQGVAKILVERQTPRPTNFEEVVQLPDSEEEYYKTQEALLSSRAVLLKALEQPGIERLPEVAGTPKGEASATARLIRTLKAVAGAAPSRPHEPWERLRGRLAVEHLRGTHLLAARAESTDPERAAQMANAVARAFEAYHVERKLRISGDASRFLREQKDEQEKRLLEAEAALQTFREKAQEVWFDVTDPRNPVLYHQTQLNEQLTKVQLQRIELAARHEVVAHAIARSGDALRADDERLFALPEVRGDPVVTKLRTDLLEAETEAATLSTTYGPAHHQVRTARAAIALLRQELQDALAHLLGSLVAELQALTKEERELEARYHQQTRAALDLADKAMEFAQLDNEVKRQQKLYDILVERMRQVDVTTSYARTNIELVEAAGVPTAPCRPRKALLIGFAAMLGLVLSALAAFALEYVDDTVKTPEDLEERVGIPVLGFVPDMEGEDGEDNGFQRNLVALLEPRSLVSEAFRSIRTNLFYAAPPDQTRVVAITSSSPGDGKTTTATNLAVVLAQSGKRVLLIDADLRKPMIHKIFGLRRSRGLSTVLVGQATLDEAIQRATHDGEQVPSLDILPAGPKPPNPAELLDSPAMGELLAEARRRYDRVVVDTPPTLFVADASIVAGLSDGVVLVVKSAANPRSVTLRAREQLRSVNGRILGGVLNDVFSHRLARYNSSYSYYGYSRYYGDRADVYYGHDEPEEPLEAAEELADIEDELAEIGERLADIDVGIAEAGPPRPHGALSPGH